MKELIRRILKEQVEVQDKIQACQTNPKVNEYMKTFALWRTALCNQDTFKTPEERARIISQNFKGQNQIKLEDGTVISKPDFEQKLNNDYEERIQMCNTQYQGERTQLSDVCNDIIINEYSNETTRKFFNRYMKYPPVCDAFVEGTCSEPKPLQSKSFQLLQRKIQDLPKLSYKPVQIPIETPQRTKTQQIIHNIKKKFG